FTENENFVNQFNDIVQYADEKFPAASVEQYAAEDYFNFDSAIPTFDMDGYREKEITLYEEEGVSSDTAEQVTDDNIQTIYSGCWTYLSDGLDMLNDLIDTGN